MMPTLTSPSVLSAPQRRCRVLLTLFQPGQIATTETFSALNGVDDEIAREDITETAWRSSAIIDSPSQRVRTDATESRGLRSTNVCAFYTGSDAAYAYARLSLRNSLRRH